MPPAARQGPIVAATGLRRKSVFHPHQFQPLGRPQETAEACRTSTAPAADPEVLREVCGFSLADPEARFSDGLGGRQPGWFSYTRGRKNQQGTLNRDQATLEQALKPWAEETHGDSHRTFQQDGANWSGSGHTARATQKRREKKYVISSAPRSSGPHHRQI